MRKLLLAALALFALTGAAFAGDNLVWGVYGSAGVQPIFLDVSGLNSYLAEAHVHRFSPVVPTIGGALQVVLDERYRFGIDNYTFLTYETGRQVEAHFAGDCFTVFFGYDAISTPVWRLRPVIGLGVSVLALTVDGVNGHLHNVALPANDDILTYQSNSTIGKAGLVIEWTPTLWHKANGLIGMTLSFSGGMMVPLTDNGWQITASGAYDADAHGTGPKVQMLAGYAALGVSFGGGITDGATGAK